MPNATSDSFQKETQRVAWPHREIWMQGNEQGTACHFPPWAQPEESVYSQPLAASPSGYISEGVGKILWR